MAKAGKIRQSAALTTFGPGALVDFIHGSFMPMGPDFWDIGPNNRRIHELDLQKHLGVGFFYPPPHENSDGFIKAKRFPEWLVCTNRDCCRLGTVEDPTKAPRDPHEAFKLNQSTGVVTCQSCRQPRAWGNPTRFVCVCTGRRIVTDNKGRETDPVIDYPQTGHLSDFPWDDWCHQGMHRDPNNIHILFLREGDGLSFDSMRVKCACQGKNHPGTSMDGIFSGPLKIRDYTQGNQLKFFQCSGSSPWLGQMNRGCQCSTRVMQRGATSLHQAVTTTFVSIPPITNDIHKDIERYLESFIIFWDGMQLMGASPDLNVAAQAYYNGQMLRLGFPAHYPISSVTQILVDHATSGKAANPVAQTMSDRKDQEFQMLCQVHGSPKLDFQTEEAFGPGILDTGIEKAMFVRRLREVTALQGFRREVPSSSQGRANPEPNAQANVGQGVQGGPGVDYVDLFLRNGQLMVKGKPQWLPAINLYGEGIFIQLAEPVLDNLVLDSRIPDRIEKLTSRLSILERDKCYASRFSTTWDLSPFLGDPILMARLLVAHTTSHLLIRELSLECGYSSASLKERIYASPKSFGLLIYSTTPGADGTRGGLVRMAEEQRFRPIFQNAIEKARWCSSDPICGTTNGQGTESLNLGACHGCALIPETSCELRNQFLDRCLITKSLSAGVPGFFC